MSAVPFYAIDSSTRSLEFARQRKQLSTQTRNNNRSPSCTDSTSQSPNSSTQHTSTQHGERK